MNSLFYTKEPEFVLKRRLKLEGEGYEALELHRLLSVDLSGPVTVSGEETRNGLLMQFGGSGTAHIKEVWAWFRLAGKPVVKNVTTSQPM